MFVVEYMPYDETRRLREITAKVLVFIEARGITSPEEIMNRVPDITHAEMRVAVNRLLDTKQCLLMADNMIKFLTRLDLIPRKLTNELFQDLLYGKADFQ